MQRPEQEPALGSFTYTRVPTVTLRGPRCALLFPQASWGPQKLVEDCSALVETLRGCNFQLKQPAELLGPLGLM